MHRSQRRLVTRAVAVLSSVVTIGSLTASPASASATVGATFDPLGTCNAGFTFVQSPDPVGTSYAVGAAGVITSWQFRAAPLSVPQIKFKVFRPAGSGSFLVVHSSAVVAPAAGMLNSYPAQMPVKAGDVIGLATLTSGKCDGSGSASMVAGDAPVGSTLSYGPAPGTLDVAAVVEADSDGDGYGDETQDGCPSQVTSQGACDLTAPSTTITKGPQPTFRTTVMFRFVSDDAGATFECRLKGKNVRSAQLQQYRPCSSPKKVKHLKVGNYKFQVRGIDAVGNREKTPAKWKFIVKAR